MRTSEEVKNAIAEYIGDTDGSSPYYTAYLDQLILYKELAEAQDAEIARLREHFTWKRTKPDPDDETIHIVHCVAGKPYYFPLPPLPQAQENNHE